MTTQTEPSNPFEPAPKYAGADWVEQSLRKPLSPLGRKVADILGQVFRGIYHIAEAVKNVDWANKRCIELVGRGGYLGCLATYDGRELADLVVLCHDAAIRLEISPCLVPWDAAAGDPQMGDPALKLMFHQRKHDGVRLYERHPTLEQAVEAARRLGRAMGGNDQGR